MNDGSAIFTLLIVVATAVVSYRGFKSFFFLEKYVFDSSAVLIRREYHRLVTGAFLHAGWGHLLFNMFSLFSFGAELEARFGARLFLTVYFASVVGGSALSLLLHRHREYRALGASGGVCGIIFAAVFLIPGGSVMIFPVPLPIPSWAYAVFFVLVSFLGMRNQASLIGHDAHLGGAIVGLLAATAMHPRIVAESPLLYSLIAGMTAALLLYSYLYPPYLQGTGYSPYRRLRVFLHARGERLRREEALSDDREIDRLLEKISRSGMNSLSGSERKRLEAVSRRRSGSGAASANQREF